PISCIFYSVYCVAGKSPIRREVSLVFAIILRAAVLIALLLVAYRFPQKALFIPWSREKFTHFGQNSIIRLRIQNFLVVLRVFAAAAGFSGFYRPRGSMALIVVAAYERVGNRMHRQGDPVLYTDLAHQLGDVSFDGALLDC